MFRIQGTGTSPTADRVATFLEGAINRLYAGATKETGPPGMIHARLTELASDPGRSRQLVVLLASREGIAALAKADASRPVLHQLRLDPVSPRSAGIPLYLFARAQTVEEIRQKPQQRRRVAFGVSNRTRDLFDREGARTILERVLGVSPDVVATTLDPSDLVDHLLEANRTSPRAADLVAIYDDEPSVLIHDFLEIYRPRAALGAELRVQLFLLPTKDPSLTPELRRIGPAGGTFSISAGEAPRFNDLAPLLPKDGRDGYVAFAPQYKSPQGGGDFPLMLSNVRTALNEAAARQTNTSLQRIASLSYLVALLTTESTDRCLRLPDQTSQTYLLQALFADAQSLPKSLALWSNVQISSPKSASSRQRPEDELIERMVNDRLAALATTTKRLDYQKLVAGLASRPDLLGTRQQFSGDYATLYRSATDEVEKVVWNPTSDVQSLLRARQALLKLLLDGKGPTCDLHGPGLFGAKGYDPFLYLSLIDSLVSIQSGTTGKRD